MSQTEGKMTREEIIEICREMCEPEGVAPYTRFEADTLRDLALSALAHDASLEGVLTPFEATEAAGAIRAGMTPSGGMCVPESWNIILRKLDALASRADSAAVGGFALPRETHEQRFEREPAARITGKMRNATEPAAIQAATCPACNKDVPSPGGNLPICPHCGYQGSRALFFPPVPAAAPDVKECIRECRYIAAYFEKHDGSPTPTIAAELALRKAAILLSTPHARGFAEGLEEAAKIADTDWTVSGHGAQGQRIAAMIRAKIKPAKDKP